MANQHVEFANKLTVAADDDLEPVAQLNNQFQGVQDEMERRFSDALKDGVISGMTVTDGTTQAVVGSGKAYVSGDYYTGSVNISLSGQPAGWYRFYIDGADGEYKATTASLTSGQLKLAAGTWTGTTLSAIYDDEKVMGVIAGQYVVQIAGQVSTGIRPPIPVEHDIWIENVEVLVAGNDITSGTASVDVHLGPDGEKGTTIFTTQGRRPIIESSDAGYTIATSGEADGDRKPDAGEHVVPEVDGVGSAGTCSDMTIVINWRYR